MPLDQWHYVEIDLDAFKGKTIKKVLVAYDDTLNSETGAFRGYIDDLYIGPRQTLEAEIVSYKLPEVLYTIEEFTTEVSVKNTGIRNWSESIGVRLGAIEDSDPLAIGRHSIAEPQVVKYGDVYTFTFRMKAPSRAGNYTTDWRIVQDGVSWFGDQISRQVVVKDNI